MNIRHFLRMSNWARRPPSDTRVKIVIGVIVLCVLLAGVEWLVGWPEWLTLEQTPRAKIAR